MSDESTEKVQYSNMDKQLMARYNLPLLEIKLADVYSDHIPAKLYEYAFKKYVKDNKLEDKIESPRDLAIYLALDQADNVIEQTT